MKTIISLIAIIVATNIVACKSQDNNSRATENAQKAINEKLAADDFSKKLATTPHAQLIDVRTPGEYEEGHLKNAININYNAEDFEEQISKLNKKAPVFVYCLSGGRSSSAADRMEELGFSAIYNLKGGVMKWQSEGKPMETGKSSPRVMGMTMDDFNKKIAGNKTVLVDYNAQWCEPCKKMLPVLEAIAASRKDRMELMQIDADEHKELIKQKGISGIPYLELYRDGQLIWNHSGYIDEAQLLKETNL